MKNIILITFLLFSTIKAQVYSSLDSVVLGGGCFWCIEAIYEEVEGVVSAESGYMGKEKFKPTYKLVSSGNTDYAEVVKVVYDTTKLSYLDVLEIFYSVHNPTTLNRQGADKGKQYRSVIFYKNREQKEIVQHLISVLDDKEIWDNKIVTTLEPYTVFYSAEKYHQDYYELNADKNPYCNVVITPKLEKFRKVFEEKLK